MAELEGHDAFEALSAVLAGTGTAEGWRARSPSIDRIRTALSEQSPHASSLDLAVLLRQALRHEHARRSYVISPTVRLRHPRLMAFTDWSRVGLTAITTNDSISIAARPWSPHWLPPIVEGVDGYSASEHVLRNFNGGETTGDPFLKSINRTAYRSPGQRAAVRAALCTPPGGTLVIALPTGEGKSMVFQLVKSVGFVGAQPESRGVTLVIVPTVALAVNHEQEAVQVCGLERPLAFQGGDDAQNAIIAERIADGSLGLCFASPEAACGRLRSPLRIAAEQGYLRALVIDEAHLVDQWGTGFRTEFQELSSLRRELIGVAQPEQRMRTLLLSATLTETSLETLQTLFGTEGSFESIAAVQLRPEPDYWIAPATAEDERVARVIEALYHTPRPAVLYVTQVIDCDAWYARLLEAGFKRIAKLHGETGREQRERIVDAWRRGKLDIVVGTSAFGLGIDYPHARSVIHACVPETLDRFYQEVGRGGRDGCASLSLIIPAAHDFATAEKINRQQVISDGRGLHRWTAMFNRKRKLDGGGWAVRIDGRPGNAEEDIDMFGEANTDWNLRVLALMARAGLIRMLGTPHPRIETAGDWLKIEILHDGHLDKDVWRTRVGPLREQVSRANWRNLTLMRQYLRDECCPADILEELYGANRLGRVCSRCSRCRVLKSHRRMSRPVGEPRAPWREPPSLSIVRLLGHDGRLLVTYDPENLRRPASRRLAESFRRLQQAGVSKLLVMGEQPFEMQRVLEFATKVPFFVSQPPALAYSRLPNGPEIVMVANNFRLEPANLTPRVDVQRIFITPKDYLGPDGRRLRDVFGSTTLTLDEFNARVSE